MSLTVCIATTDVVPYQDAGGHFWACLNWPLGMREIGCDVIWLDAVGRRKDTERLRSSISRFFVQPMGTCGIAI
jgi:hypothetical protein